MEYLNLAYPAGYVFLVVLTGLAYATVLYYREKKFLDKPWWLRATLFGSRAISISLITFFLLEPFSKKVTEEVRKPVLILAEDASSSIASVHPADSLKRYLADFKSMASELEDHFNVKSIHFGNGVQGGITDSFDQKSTNISAVYQYVVDQFYGMPVAGLVMITDGNFNEGKNPLYLEEVSSIPFYGIALGDTVKRADVAIRNSYYNRIVFLGDSIGIQFDLSAFDFEGTTVAVKLEEIDQQRSRTIGQKVVKIDRREFFRPIDFALTTNRTGNLHYRISLESAGNDAIRENNFQDLFIEVIDSRVKVLLVGLSPHPDITAIKQGLEANTNFQVKVQMINQPDDVKDQDVVILHNLPATEGRGLELIQQLRRTKTPHLFITGQQTLIPSFNSVQDILSIRNSLPSGNESQAIVNPGFSSFELDPGLNDKIRQLPPMTVPYGEYTPGVKANILLYQKIGQVETKYPLLAFSDQDGLKTGVISGEGIWKWRLNQYGREGNSAIVDQLIHKSIQYLALKEDKRRWQVAANKNIWDENERILFKASYYNANYELNNDAEATMKITGNGGDSYEFLFNRTEQHYTLDAGFLPPGEYRYTAVHQDGIENEQFSGSFIIKALQAELANLEARHDILYQLGEASGGGFYRPQETGILIKQLLDKNYKPIIYSQEKYVSLLDLKWIFILLIALLGLEWFLRRYHGTY